MSIFSTRDEAANQLNEYAQKEKVSIHFLKPIYWFHFVLL